MQFSQFPPSEWKMSFNPLMDKCSLLTISRKFLNNAKAFSGASFFPLFNYYCFPDEFSWFFLFSLLSFPSHHQAAFLHFSFNYVYRWNKDDCKWKWFWFIDFPTLFTFSPPPKFLLSIKIFLFSRKMLLENCIEN